MSYLGPSDFARRVGISRNSVYHHLRGGRLVRAKNGKLNLANPTNIAFMNRDKEGIVKTSKSGANGSGQTRADAELRKVQAKTEQIEIKTAKDRQELVERSLVRWLFGILATIDQNEFLTIPANVASEIAGLCGKEDSKTVVKIAKLLEEKMYGVLQHRERVVKDFLEKVKAEPLKSKKKKKRVKSKALKQ